jgi:hypothetical protein
MQVHPSARHQAVPKSLVADTFDMTHTAAELRPPPGQHASLDERMDFLQQQLDSIGMGRAILSGLLLLGGGSNQRIQGGEPSAYICK